MARLTIGALTAEVQHLTILSNKQAEYIEKLKEELRLVRAAKTQAFVPTSIQKQCNYCYKWGCTEVHPTGKCEVCHAPVGKPHATKCTVNK